MLIGSGVAYKRPSVSHCRRSVLGKGLFYCCHRFSAFQSFPRRCGCPEESGSNFIGAGAPPNVAAECILDRIAQVTNSEVR